MTHLEIFLIALCILQLIIDLFLLKQLLKWYFMSPEFQMRELIKMHEKAYRRTRRNDGLME